MVISKHIHSSPAQAVMLLLAFLFSLPASASTYSVQLDDVDWQLQEEKHFKCSILQKVPLFGSVAISAKAGRRLVLELQTSLFPALPASVQLWLKPQGWGRFSWQGADNTGQQVPVTAYQLSDTTHWTGLDLKLGLSVRQLLVMLDGQRLLSAQILKRTGGGTYRLIDVQLPTVGMLPAMTRMSQCITSLLPRDFQQLQQYNLHYALGRFQLDGNQRQWLIDTARYVAVDDNIVEITIDGNSDNTPFQDSDETIDRLQNLELSKQRADVVRDHLDRYLQEAGVTRRVKIVTRYHGERYPVASNDTAAGRYQNRRVEVTLLTSQDKNQAAK